MLEEVTSKRTREPRTIAVSKTISSAQRLLDTAAVLDFCCISDDTLAKLLEADDFPAPIVLRRGKRHWTLGALEQWVRRKQEQAERQRHQ